MFSIKKLENSKPIAFVSGGKFDTSILYVNDKPEEDNYVEIDVSEGGKSDAKIKPIHDVNGRQIVYVTGQSGSGKSSMIAEYIKSYQKLHPKNSVYMICRTNHKEDPAYNGIKNMDQIDMSEPLDFVEEGLSDCLFVFDDVMTLHDKYEQKNIYDLIADIAEVGRKMNISMLISSHLILPNDVKIKRILMNELQQLCIFPRSASKHHMNYALKQYFGMDPKVIKRVTDTNSRHIIISKQYPNYVLEEQKAYPCYN